MKITSIRPIKIWIDNRPQLLVRIDTDAGVHGWGESGLTSREDAVAAAVSHYAAWLVGRDPMNIAALWQEMYRSQYFEGGRVLTAAISAIDIALHDIKGKALGVPVWQLLGGKQRDYIDTFATVRSQDIDEILVLTTTLLRAGWSCIRLPRKEAVPAPDGGHPVFEPRESLAITAEWVTRVRAEIGPGPLLGLDYHHRLTVAEAASFCQRLAPGALDWIEEPIRDETPAAYEALRRMTPIPFAIGEEFASKWQFLPYVERDITQYARIDVCNVGGFTEAMKVAGWCEAHYVDVMPHNPLGPICTAATIHMSAAIANLAWAECWETPGETLPREDPSVFIDRPMLVGHRYPVPNRPGLGIDVDETQLEAVTRDGFFEFPHLRRRDGSHTNW
ncbi:mandelate racemase/muconate lactonizing enzyme family protein [Bosea thiooxidans]|nr:mandelate racemase/muconate lactonizing enzyme family protein [Bosea sp. (in: a-proteobacteria)]